MTPEVVTSLEKASLGYGKHAVLSELNFEIRKGDFVGIIGPNGSGKTTILRTVLGLLEPLSGSVFRNTNLQYSYVKQRQFLDSLYPFNVTEIVMMGRYPRMGMFAHAKEIDIKKAEDALRISGVYEDKNSLFRELSEGQKQRVLLARALISDPDVLLLDEPTNDLDIKGEEQIMQLLRDIHTRYGTTIIMVSHLLNVVLNYAKGIIFLGKRSAKRYDIQALCEKGMLEEIYGIPLAIEKVKNKLAIIP